MTSTRGDIKFTVFAYMNASGAGKRTFVKKFFGACGVTRVILVFLKTRSSGCSPIDRLCELVYLCLCPSVSVSVPVRQPKIYTPQFEKKCSCREYSHIEFEFRARLASGVGSGFIIFFELKVSFEFN